MITKKPTILVVEDHEDCVYLWHRYAERVGFRLLTAHNGEDALLTVRQERPTLIFLDIQLPGMNGWQTLCELKGDPVTSDIPVVMCSSLNQIERAFFEGADGYVRKPMHFQEVAEWINWAQKMQEMSDRQTITHYATCECM